MDGKEPKAKTALSKEVSVAKSTPKDPDKMLTKAAIDFTEWYWKASDDTREIVRDLLEANGVVNDLR